MGIFRFTDKYAAPTREQRERYLTGRYEEHRYGPEGRILLIEYPEAAYLKDDVANIRVLYTGPRDKRKGRDEAKRLESHYQRKVGQKPPSRPEPAGGRDPERPGG